MARNVIIVSSYSGLLAAVAMANADTGPTQWTVQVSDGLTIALTADLTMPDDVLLVVPSGSFIEIPSDITLSLKTDLYTADEGAFIGDGTLTVSGVGSVVVPTVEAWLTLLDVDPSGILDSSAGLSAAITSVQAAGGGTITVPPGTHRIGADASVPAGILLDIQPGAVVSVDSGKTLSLSCSVPDFDRQMFSGPGAVVFSAGAVPCVRAAWFGMVSDCTIVHDQTSATVACSSASADVEVTSGLSSIVDGQSILLAGADKPFRVLSVSGSTVTLERATGLTGSVAATGYNGNITYGGTDNTAAIQASIAASANARELRLPAGSFRFADTIQVLRIYDDLSIIGSGRHRTFIYFDHVDRPGMNIQGVRDATLSDFTFCGRNGKVWADNTNGAFYPVDQSDLFPLLIEPDPTKWTTPDTVTTASVPSCGIVIDGLWKSGGGADPSPKYPSGTYDPRASAGVDILRVNGSWCYIAFATSPALTTPQGDTLTYRKCLADSNALSHAFGSAQNRTCIVAEGRYNRCHTFLSTQTYCGSVGSMVTSRDNQITNCGRIYNMATPYLGQCVISGDYGEVVASFGNFGHSVGSYSSSVSISGGHYSFLGCAPVMLFATGQIDISGAKFLLDGGQAQRLIVVFGSVASQAVFRGCHFRSADADISPVIAGTPDESCRLSFYDCSIVDAKTGDSMTFGDVQRVKINNASTATRARLITPTTRDLLVEYVDNSPHAVFALSHSTRPYYRHTPSYGEKVNDYTYLINFAAAVAYKQLYIVGDIVSIGSTSPDVQLAGSIQIPVGVVTDVSAAGGGRTGYDVTIEIPPAYRAQCKTVAYASPPCLYPQQRFALVHAECSGTKTAASAVVASVSNVSLLKEGDIIQIEGETAGFPFRIVDITGSNVTLHAACSASGTARIFDSMARRRSALPNVTAQRPTNGLYPGYPFFDLTLGYPIWYDGSGWIDSSGGSV